MGSVAMAVSTCMVGACKVAVFAATWGRVQPQVSTGFLWLGERTFSSSLNMALALSEVLFDTASVGLYCYDKVAWVATACKLDVVVKAVKWAVLFVANRLVKGFQKALGDERISEVDDKLFWPLDALSHKTDTYSYFKRAEHEVSHWCMHKLFSVVNISLNSAIAVVAGVGCLATSVALFSKTFFYAGTGVHVQAATGWGYSATLVKHSVYNVVRDITAISQDVAFIASSLVNRLRVLQLFSSVGESVADVRYA